MKLVLSLLGSISSLLLGSLGTLSLGCFVCSFNFYLMHMGVYLVTCMCAMCMQCHWRPEEGVICPRN